MGIIGGKDEVNNNFECKPGDIPGSDRVFGIRCVARSLPAAPCGEDQTRLQIAFNTPGLQC